MAETSGDVVAIATPVGNVEALRMGRTEAGQSRWQVRYPWGVETFFGTSAEVTTQVHLRAGKAADKFSGDARQMPGRRDQAPDA